MSISASYPNLRPTLLLDFANSGRLDPRVTFTRASTATFFDETGVLQSAAIDVPRFDYNPATLAAQGLLIEEQRTNLLTYSEQFDDVAWAKQAGSAVTPNTVVAPDGTTTADRIYGDGTQNGYVERSLSITSGIFYAFSCFFKKNNTSTIIIFLAGAQFNSGGSSVFATFNLDTGVATTTNGGTAAMVPVGNGWYRCSFVKDATTTTTTNQQVIRLAGNSGDVYAWGYQLEAGAFPTSYIPTTTTALTRAADVASVNTLSPWFNGTEGTLFAQGILVGGPAAFPYQVALVGSNANTDSIGINWSSPSGQMRFVTRVSSSGQADLNAGSNKTAGSSYKVAGRYAANNFQIAVDGTLGTPDTSGSIPTIAALSLGGVVSFQPGANVWLQRVTYYPRVLADAELQAITS